MIKELEKKPAMSIANTDTGSEVNKNIIISVPYVPGLNEEFRRSFGYTSVQVIFKAANTINTFVCIPR